MGEHLYATVARELAEGMASGRYPVGSLLPTEMELSRQYGASRQTIRAAMQELQHLGLVSRRKHVGTRVEAAQPSGGFNQTLASLDDLVQHAATHSRVVRAVDAVVADLELAKELNCAAGTKWLRVSEIRLEDDKARRPLCLTDVYFDATYSELKELVPKSPKTLISTMIETRYGRRAAEVHQSIRAVTLSPAQSADLAALPGSPALKVTRRYLDKAGVAFEVSITTYPADRYTFSMKLKRERKTR
jgi:DNA-binding GntR family transcriptional regulator